MKDILVKEVMVSISDYPSVDEDSTLYEVVAAMEDALKTAGRRLFPPRAVLILDKTGRIRGKFGQLELLESLEPRYEEPDAAITRTNFTPEFIKAQFRKLDLWQKPLEDICRKAARIRMADIVRELKDAEIIEEDATLDQAVHRMIVEKLQSLLVRRGEQFVGILRLVDVAERIRDMIKVCETPTS
jgi:CBS domain-containing protein